MEYRYLNNDRNVSFFNTLLKKLKYGCYDTNILSIFVDEFQLEHALIVTKNAVKKIQKENSDNR